jgi:hypothetical protein
VLRLYVLQRGYNYTAIPLKRENDPLSLLKEERKFVIYYYFVGLGSGVLAVDLDYGNVCV